MKFIVKNLTKCAPRSGIIQEIKRLPDLSFNTPMVMLYTRVNIREDYIELIKNWFRVHFNLDNTTLKEAFLKGGSVPHLTREVLQMSIKEPHCIQLPLVTTSSFIEPMSECKETIADFVGLKEYMTYVTVQDPAELTLEGHHVQNNVPIWTKSGKIHLNADNFMSTIESFKPDMYCILSDGDTNKTSAKKRISKSVDRTLSLFSSCLEKHKASEVLKDSLIVAAIEGGYCLISRQKCIEGLLQNSEVIGGFLIDGLHNNGPIVESMLFKDVKEIVEKTINLLPAEKLRMIQGCWNPLIIVDLVSIGIDLFDTSYVHTVTERHSALTFNFDISMTDNANEEFEINFKEKQYSDDFSPILKDCKCLTCSKYSRAYIHHLINVQELLGPILLHMHNLHHYLEFFKKIRECVELEALAKLRTIISVQVEKHFSKINKAKTIEENV